MGNVIITIGFIGIIGTILMPSMIIKLRLYFTIWIPFIVLRKRNMELRISFVKIRFWYVFKSLLFYSFWLNPGNNADKEGGIKEWNFLDGYCLKMKEFYYICIIIYYLYGFRNQKYIPGHCFGRRRRAVWFIDIRKTLPHRPDCFFGA